MYVHAEAGPDGTPLNDDDLTCFIRLGNDFENNYYEYEIPMKVTPGTPGTKTPYGQLRITSTSSSASCRTSKSSGLRATRCSKYTGLDSEYNARLAVKGNPNLANVVMVMVGVRNPDKDDNVFDSDDDGLDKCSVVWVNEMRLADFNQKGGWAVTAQMNAKLADLGNVSVAANMSTPGFGGVGAAHTRTPAGDHPSH